MNFAFPFLKFILDTFSKMTALIASATPSLPLDHSHPSLTSQALFRHSATDVGATHLEHPNPNSESPFSDSQLHSATKGSTLSTRGFDCVIFDLGDVLFTWAASPNIAVPGKVLHKILRTASWFEYEKGNITEEQAYQTAANEFGYSADDIADAFRCARDSLRSSPELVEFISKLKEEHGTRFFAMSNISAPDWDVLSQKMTPKDWTLFDRVFTSAAAHERKPNLAFFQHVLNETGVDPSRTVFVDDKVENVVSARSFGLHGVVFTSLDEVVQQLRAAFTDASASGLSYLRQHAKSLKSLTNTGVVLEENFAQMLIEESTGDPTLVDYIKYPRLSNFFKGE